jgi:hypothetical protein
MPVMFLFGVHVKTGKRLHIRAFLLDDDPLFFLRNNVWADADWIRRYVDVQSQGELMDPAEGANFTSHATALMQDSGWCVHPVYALSSVTLHFLPYPPLHASTGTIPESNQLLVVLTHL